MEVRRQVLFENDYIAKDRWGVDGWPSDIFPTVCEGCRAIPGTPQPLPFGNEGAHRG